MIHILIFACILHDADLSPACSTLSEIYCQRQSEIQSQPQRKAVADSCFDSVGKAVVEGQERARAGKETR
jgi:hypothetical protein